MSRDEIPSSYEGGHDKKINVPESKNDSPLAVFIGVVSILVIVIGGGWLVLKLLGYVFPDFNNTFDDFNISSIFSSEPEPLGISAEEDNPNSSKEPYSLEWNWPFFSDDPEPSEEPVIQDESQEDSDEIEPSPSPSVIPTPTTATREKAEDFEPLPTPFATPFSAPLDPPNSSSSIEPLIPPTIEPLIPPTTEPSTSNKAESTKNRDLTSKPTETRRRQKNSPQINHDHCHHHHCPCQTHCSCQQVCHCSGNCYWLILAADRTKAAARHELKKLQRCYADAFLKTIPDGTNFPFKTVLGPYSSYQQAMNQITRCNPWDAYVIKFND